MVVSSPDTNSRLLVSLSHPSLHAPDGSELPLTFSAFDDTLDCTIDNAWSALKSDAFALPEGLTDATLSLARTILPMGGEIDLPLIVGIEQVSSGTILATDTLTSGSTPISDQMSLPFHGSSGTQLRFFVRPDRQPSLTLTASLVNLFTLDGSNSAYKTGIFGLGHRARVGEYSLSPGYPNPFNPSTTIQYSLKADSHVRLSITNVLGQEVRLLVNGFQSGGYQSAVFEAGDLGSGIYFARLLVTDTYGKQVYNATEKLLLVK